MPGCIVGSFGELWKSKFVTLSSKQISEATRGAHLGLEVLGEEVDPLGDPSSQRLLQGPRVHPQEASRRGRGQCSDVILPKQEDQCQPLPGIRVDSSLP